MGATPGSSQAVRNAGEAAVTHAPLLEVTDLVVEFRQGRSRLLAANHLSLFVRQGETLGIVGESGSGKSVLCRTIMRLLPSPPAFVRSGSVRFGGMDLLTLPEEHMREIRGADIAMVFQNPMNALNPVWPIGDQVSEGLRTHQGLGRRAARDRAIELLTKVGIPSPELRVDDYPHQWSGGMVQRAVIAMAMANEPKLILADEPTTALDVTIQDQILALLMDLQSSAGMSLVLVSHDMAIVAETCDRVAVMYAGRVVELADTDKIFRTPRHPYTLGLMRSIPSLDGIGDRLEPIPGAPPNLSTLPPGCPFAPRCRFAQAECRTEAVTLREIAPDHFTACLFPERIEGSMV